MEDNAQSPFLKKFPFSEELVLNEKNLQILSENLESLLKDPTNLAHLESMKETLREYQQKLNEDEIVLRKWTINIKELNLDSDMPPQVLYENIKQSLQERKGSGGSERRDSCESRKDRSGSLIKISLPKPPDLDRKHSRDEDVQSEDSNSQRRHVGSKNLSRMQQTLAESNEDQKKRLQSQVPINIFWNYIEGFFKPITEEDYRKLFDVKQLDPSLLTIPPLGKNIKSDGSNSVTPTFQASDSPSLVSRLLACLIEESIISVKENGTEFTASTELISVQSSDERLRRRLVAEKLILGTDASEDDEISAEIRILQNLLKSQHEINCRRKKKLAEAMYPLLEVEKYHSAVESIDRHIEGIVARKWSMKKKKKGQQSNASAVHEIIPLIRKREELVNAFNNVVPSRAELMNNVSPLFGGVDALNADDLSSDAPLKKEMTKRAPFFSK